VFTLGDLTRYIKIHIVEMKRLQPPLRPLIWVGGSKKDYLRFPDAQRHDFGFRLYRVQAGKPAPGEKPLNQGVLKGCGIREMVDDGEDGTYRVVYTVQLRAGVYVLHAFKKKSKHGIATPKHEIDLVRQRYDMAVAIDEASSPL
jgi:phage-related protein